jgi:hypothetical protein
MSWCEEWRAFIEQELTALERMVDQKADECDVAKNLSCYFSDAYGLKGMPRKERLKIMQEKFGRDLEQDFATVFEAIDRLTKRKLDVEALTDFASVPFVDTLYQRKSVQFSARVAEVSLLYYRLFDAKIKEMHGKLLDFQRSVEERLSITEARTEKLRSILKRLRQKVSEPRSCTSLGLRPSSQSVRSRKNPHLK